MDSQAVREIQESLRLLAAYDPRLQPITVDGIYAASTTNAVRIFQTLHALDPSGTVDRDTWEELRDSVADLQPPLPLIIRYIENMDASIVQWMINELAGYYHTLNPVDINGLYDDKTQEQIRRIQLWHDIEPSGIPDIPTWNILVTLYQNRTDTVKR